MTQNNQLIKERFDLQITDAETLFKSQFELNKNSKILIGIMITSDRDDLLYYRGSQKILINDNIELFPENYESKLLMAGLNVAPDERMVSLGNVATGNGRLHIWYQDSEHSVASFEEYRVSIYTFSLTQFPNEESHENLHS